MPELPEIAVLAHGMQKELVGRTVSSVEVLQPKCLNLPADEFQAALIGAQIREVTSHGKWLRVETTKGWLLLGLGMGGEILLTDRGRLPEKYRLIFDFEDGSCLAINFWWFGYAHHVSDLADHKMTATLGPHALDLTLDEFRELLRGRRGGVKSFLLNQKPLFKAGIHPLRHINTLNDDEIASLWLAIRETLQESIDHGGSAWELDLYGVKGRWDASFFCVGYREGQPCPVCDTAVEKIKTGSTSSFICPRCQPLEH
jgi:formamidopyrimidine-DNA glycosylase